MHFQYPLTRKIQPAGGPVKAVCHVPGSKSVGNRALVLAALGAAKGPCELTGLLHSEDTEVMVDSLGRLGWKLETDWESCRTRISCKPVDSHSRSIVPAEKADLFVANSGTTMRFLAALCSLGHGKYRLDGVQRMRERPLGDLIAALQMAGAEVHCERSTGCPPVFIQSEGWKANRIRVGGEVSSQFLSGLLLAAPFAGHPLVIETTGKLVSEPYVEMTIRMIRDWGGIVLTEAAGSFTFPKQGPCQRREYAIEPDASAATYFWAMAAITGGEVLVPGLAQGSLQGDVAFVKCLEKMGCSVAWEKEGIRVRGGSLRGIEVDMNAISDTVMTLASVALFASGPTIIKRVGHIRHKETDRIHAVATELGRLGIRVDESDDGLIIHPGPIKPARVMTYQDHRMAMSLALVGLRVPGLEVDDPGCVAKTYPGFWNDFDKAVIAAAH